MESSGFGSSADALQDDIDILRRELSAIEAKRQELLAQIELEEEGIANDAASIAPAQVPEEEKEQRRMLDILMAYRLTGVTVFTEDEFDDQSSTLDFDDDQSGKEPIKKQIGIRIETFAQAKYYEPYYIMLRIKDAKNKDDDDYTAELEVTNHTIPHWIPLRDLVRRHLNRDMKMFTRKVSEYLQAFVVRRENINKLLRDFSTAADSLPKNTSSAADNSVSPPFQRPSIIVQSKDAAIRDVVLYITHFRTLFRLYNRLMAKQKRQVAKAKLAQAPTTITKSGLSKLLSDNDLDMDVDSDSEMDQGLIQENKDLLRELVTSREMHSAQIRLVYEDLTTTQPSRVHIRFRRNYEVQEDPDLWREQRPVWTRILQSDRNLVEAFTKIANSIRE
ncbi:MAG: Cenp-O kinetochore centromere component-domain-containing protein [Podila humilis]|nr:MAG: Cenp-O kinetochore centromere component-domain-containing protein [Podila humilis]